MDTRTHLLLNEVTTHQIATNTQSHIFGKESMCKFSGGLGEGRQKYQLESWVAWRRLSSSSSIPIRVTLGSIVDCHVGTGRRSSTQSIHTPKCPFSRSPPGTTGARVHSVTFTKSCFFSIFRYDLVYYLPIRLDYPLFFLFGQCGFFFQSKQPSREDAEYISSVSSHLGLLPGILGFTTW